MLTALLAAEPLWDFSRVIAPEHIWANLGALVTLTLMEVVLGIDNIVFIAIVAGQLPEGQQKKARQTGLMLALVTRVALLATVTYIMGLAEKKLGVTVPFTGHDLTGKDLVLIGGGLFLIYKATKEIHIRVEGEEEGHETKEKAATFWGTIVQILIIDMVFSIDSVVTAVGMAKELIVMVAAVILSVGIMLLTAGPVSDFIKKHPTMKMLALSFLLLIGVMLLAEAVGQHIQKGYIYFAMSFSLIVEMLNIVSRRKRKAGVVGVAAPGKSGGEKTGA